MHRTALLAVPAAAVVAAYILGSPHRPTAAAPPTPAEIGFVVDGVGRTTGVPAVLRVNQGVSIRRGDVRTARRDANSRLRTLRTLCAVLRKDRVADADVQTSQVDLQQAYDDKSRRNGSVVNEQVTVKLHDVATAGPVITDAIQTGGNGATLQGVAFSLEDDAALLGKARDAAYDDAKAKVKAQQYAELSGKRLGDVQLLAETTTPAQPDFRSQDKVAFAQSPAASPVPMDAGTSLVSVSVRIRWSLAQQAPYGCRS